MREISDRMVGGAAGLSDGWQHHHLAALPYTILGNGPNMDVTYDP